MSERIKERTNERKKNDTMARRTDDRIFEEGVIEEIGDIDGGDDDDDMEEVDVTGSGVRGNAFSADVHKIKQDYRWLQYEREKQKRQPGYRKPSPKPKRKPNRTRFTGDLRRGFLELYGSMEDLRRMRIDGDWGYAVLVTSNHEWRCAQVRPMVALILNELPSLQDGQAFYLRNLLVWMADHGEPTQSTYRFAHSVVRDCHHLIYFLALVCSDEVINFVKYGVPRERKPKPPMNNRDRYETWVKQCVRPKFYVWVAGLCNVQDFLTECRGRYVMYCGLVMPPVTWRPSRPGASATTAREIGTYSEAAESEFMRERNRREAKRQRKQMRAKAEAERMKTSNDTMDEFWSEFNPESLHFESERRSAFEDEVRQFVATENTKYDISAPHSTPTTKRRRVHRPPSN